MAPPSALRDRWSRRLMDPIICQASGWMTIKQRAKRSGVELPLIISDHADWNELTSTIDSTEADTIWVTWKGGCVSTLVQAQWEKCRATAFTRTR